MKTKLLLIFTFFTLITNAQDAFITKWKTTTVNESITIATIGSGYNYTVNWGDGITENNFSGNGTHQYSNAGEYEVSITGDFPRIKVNGAGISNAEKLITILQWGNNKWDSMSFAFASCTNLTVTATDNPDLSNVTFVSGMFAGATSFNQDINSWDVSTVKYFDAMFKDATSFNQNINSWKLTSAVSLEAMFRGATSFNQDISAWNLESALDLNRMFYQATSFNQNISSWNIINVEDMSFMFDYSNLSIENFDSILINWNKIPSLKQNVSLGAATINYCKGEKARNELMSNFNWKIIVSGKDCSSYNAFITKWKTFWNNDSITIPTNGDGYNYAVDWGDGTIENNFTGDATHVYAVEGEYEVSITGDFPRIDFSKNSVTAQRISYVIQWGNNKWVSMENAFTDCINLRITASDNPDLDKVTDLSYMFSGATNFNDNIDSWDVSNVTNMSFMFRSAKSFNQNINSWDVGIVVNMKGMFGNSVSFNMPLNNWNVSNVTDTSYMFNLAFKFNQNINSWDVRSVVNMKGMFEHCNSFNRPLNNWNVSNVTDTSSMFNGAFDFNQDIDNWDVGNVTDMSTMFSQAENFNQELTSWNVGKVTTMAGMFQSIKKFNGSIGNWDVSNVVSMNNMFLNSEAFNQNLGNWNISNVKYTPYFKNTSLTTKNYDATLTGWSNLASLQQSVKFYAININYCNSESARNKLINDYNWTIIDGGKDCSTLSIDDNLLEPNITVYPNPVSSIVQILLSDGIILKSAEVYNLLGKRILSSENPFLEVGEFSKGVYFLKIITNKGQAQRKFIKN